MRSPSGSGPPEISKAFPSLPPLSLLTASNNSIFSHNGLHASCLHILSLLLIVLPVISKPPSSPSTKTNADMTTLKTAPATAATKNSILCLSYRTHRYAVQRLLVQVWRVHVSLDAFTSVYCTWTIFLFCTTTFEYHVTF